MNIYDEVVNPNTIAEYEDSRINWDEIRKYETEMSELRDRAGDGAHGGTREQDKCD